jgi:quercetin dioxygenase-like cupin family protein
MKALVRRSARLAVMTLGFAALIVAVNAVPGAATPANSDFQSVLKARGTYVSDGSLPLGQRLDIVVAMNTVFPGGSSGWHSHPGGAIVVVDSGEITTYRSVGNHCVITTYTAHQAFIERPGEPLIAINNSSNTTIIYATFPGVPVGVAGGQRINLPDPGTCPGV